MNDEPATVKVPLEVPTEAVCDLIPLIWDAASPLGKQAFADHILEWAIKHPIKGQLAAVTETALTSQINRIVCDEFCPQIREGVEKKATKAYIGRRVAQLVKEHGRGLEQVFRVHFTNHLNNPESELAQMVTEETRAMVQRVFNELDEKDRKRIKSALRGQVNRVLQRGE